MEVLIINTLNHGNFENHHDFEYITPDFYHQSSLLIRIVIKMLSPSQNSIAF